MVKLIFLCRRRPDITHERYAELLLGGHVPIALQHHPTLRAYVVNIVEQSPDGWEPLDSVGELSFDTLADFRERLYDSPAGQAIVERDVQGFTSGAHAYATTEHVQKPRWPDAPLGVRSPGIKLVCPLVRRTGISHAEFVAHWLTRHVPLALVHHAGLSKYVTNVVDERLSSGGDELDGIAELHFPSLETLKTGMFDSAEGERIIRDDITRFIGRTAAYRVAEYVEKVSV
ncbi:MAG: EthD family reductase [Deltaproteobacteria bacterium]|nr:EthD family reductase [Deltaproteobacteria bacterium]MBI3387063.1 EthD family reductase [Deltaproteobacteria bacterium]